MSAVDVPTPTGDDRRSEVVRGLRELADALTTDASVPTPDFVVAKWIAYKHRGATPEQFIAAAEALGSLVTIDGDRAKAKREYADSVSFAVEIPAADICVEREVTKTELVLPEGLAPPESESSEMAPADTTAVTW